MTSESIVKPKEVGRQPDEFYKTRLNKWRYRTRRIILRSLRKESEVMAQFQRRYRRNWLDTYMLWSSFLGAVTFFILLLPIPYFWGHAEQGRALLQTLAASVWITCLMKDFCCVPRPYSPPVSRISMGSSHLEYGFPSTHSTTAVAQALVLKQWLDESALTDSTKLLLHVLLGIATFSVVFGRFYCGMHSSVDCVGGVITGYLIYLTRSLIGPYYKTYISQTSWLTPLSLTALSLFAVHAHIKPAEDNPAFEDSVAFISVFLGNGIGDWFANVNGYSHATYFTTKLHGWEWYLASLFKYPLGVGMIFLTRLLTKPLMQAVLPPLFRSLHSVVGGGTQGDTQASPTEPKMDAVPSVVDLGQLKQRKESTAQTPQPLPQQKYNSRYYDADIMTRVVTYAAMGFVGTIVSPIVFEKLGWGLY
ncbi:hypothetical protein E3P99_00588 [Wallemia hederae]|uniref:Phosphatidic acid phosphatase type 2/haloperoxidase domain-containing protein n=1 Tax=Wallemia hederae TaxID=1540922 RepID=A0A4V4LUS4_9BASI|nr:hypothetical protein E3P99_00588 [Wallemia hederae]